MVSVAVDQTRHYRHVAVIYRLDRCALGGDHLRCAAGGDYPSPVYEDGAVFNGGGAGTVQQAARLDQEQLVRGLPHLPLSFSRPLSPLSSLGS